MTNQQPANADQNHQQIEALATLAGLSGASPRQIELLGILCSPEYHDGSIEGETPVELAEGFADFSGYLGFDANHEVQQVADILYTYYAGRADLPDFMFAFDCNADGEIGAYTVACSIDDWQDRLTLSTTFDIKHCTSDREASGLGAALAIAETLDNDYRALLDKVRRRGLLDADTSVIETAKAALAAHAQTPQDEDVEPETIEALLGALTGLLSAQGVTLH